MAIESSCDDTSASVIISGEIRSNVISSQLIHSKHGGVVPELASRDHQRNIITVVDQAIRKAEVELSELDAIAVTAGPGLLGSLLVGMSYAKGLCVSLNIPLIEVDHLDAHILAHFIDQPFPSLPFLCLLVSGGHTQIVQVNEPLDHKILGKTLDDAAGEAFDKGAKMLGLPYPGGPEIDKLAQQGKPVYAFNHPKVKDYDYSFSGLKTAFLYFLRDEIKENPTFIEDHLADLCASWQKVIVDYLLSKFEKAIKQTGIQSFGIAGGVSANSLLRKELELLAHKNGGAAFVPKLEYCLDNAAMIARVAAYKYGKRDFASLDLKPYTRSSKK